MTILTLLLRCAILDLRPRNKALLLTQELFLRFKIDPPGCFGFDIAIDFGQILRIFLDGNGD